MKKIFLTLCLLTIVGAGCKQASTDTIRLDTSSNNSTSTELVPFERTDNTILYVDNKNGIYLETIPDCSNIFSVKSDNNGSFSIYLPNAKNWQGNWYGYKLMTDPQYQEAVKASETQGIIKMAKLNNGLFLVAFQPQDSPNDSDLLGEFSGKVCPPPTVFFNKNQSVQGFSPTVK